jgi:hypothetical protein
VGADTASTAAPLSSLVAIPKRSPQGIPLSTPKHKNLNKPQKFSYSRNTKKRSRPQKFRKIATPTILRSNGRLLLLHLSFPQRRPSSQPRCAIRKRKLLHLLEPLKLVELVSTSRESFLLGRDETSTSRLGGLRSAELQPYGHPRRARHHGSALNSSSTQQFRPPIAARLYQVAQEECRGREWVARLCACHGLALRVLSACFWSFPKGGHLAPFHSPLQILAAPLLCGPGLVALSASRVPANCHHPQMRSIMVR